jgi:hypothetical protein
LAYPAIIEGKVAGREKKREEVFMRCDWGKMSGSVGILRLGHWVPFRIEGLSFVKRDA